jgi:hypothetical protein
MEWNVEDRIEEDGRSGTAGTRNNVPISAHSALLNKLAEGRFAK